MSDKKITKFVYQSFGGSVISDASTFGFICGSVWFNQNYCNGSYFLNAVVAILFMIWMIARGISVNDRVYSKEIVQELIKEGKGKPND